VVIPEVGSTNVTESTATRARLPGADLRWKTREDRCELECEGLRNKREEKAGVEEV